MFGYGRHASRQGRSRAAETGTAVIEFAFFLPLLILIVVGMVDVCFLMSDQINLSHIAREGSSFMSRGATLEETLDAIVIVDGSLELDGAQGRIIVTEVMAPQGGAPIIVNQMALGGLSTVSSIGFLPNGAESAPASIPNGMQLPDGMFMSVVEVFSRRDLFGNNESTGTLPSVTLTSRAVF